MKIYTYYAQFLKKFKIPQTHCASILKYFILLVGCLTALTPVSAKDIAEPAPFSEPLFTNFSSGPLSPQISSKATELLNSQASQQIENLLSFRNSRARATINPGIGSRDHFDYSLDYFFPWIDDENYTLFTQASLHRWNERDLLNAGFGYRYSLQNNKVVGGNLFFDQDMTRQHNRLGIGVEAWSERVRSSANYYLPLSGWKSSQDHQLNPDPVRYKLYERAARGWDINVEALIAQPLSAKITWFQWFGDKVDVLGYRNKVASNPYGLTFGLKWQPLPLFGFSLDNTLMNDKSNDIKLGLNLTWDFNATLQQQLDPERGRAMATSPLSRNEFVTRNNNIVLNYKTENKILPLFFNPDNLVLKAGQKNFIHSVQGGYGGIKKYTSDNQLIAQVDVNSGLIQPLKRGQTIIRAQEFQSGYLATPVNSASYHLTVIPGDMAPSAEQITITGKPEVGQTLTGSYLFVNNEGNDEVDGGSPVSWFNAHDLTTPISTKNTYKLQPADQGQEIIFEVTPVNQDKLTGKVVQAKITLPNLALGEFLITNGNTPVNEGDVVIFPQGIQGKLNLSVIVKDAQNKPVAKIPVYLSQQNPKLGNFSASTGLTDSTGKIMVSYEGIASPGTDTVSISLQPAATFGTNAKTSAVKSVSRTFNVAFSASTIEPLPSVRLKIAERKAINPKGGIVGQPYILTSNSTEVVAIEQGELVGIKTGEAEITVSQKATETVNAPVPVKFRVSVNKALSTELHADPVDVEFGAAKKMLVVTGGNNGAMSYRSADENIVKVSEKGEMTFSKAGITSITISQAATEGLLAPKDIEVSVIVKNGKPTIKELKILGNTSVGSQLTSSYTYIGNGAEEGKSTFQWMHENEWITGETGNSYRVKNTDIGHEIYLEVTPKNTLDEYGSAVKSKSITIPVIKPEVTNVKVIGEPVENSTLTLSYEYIDNGINEGATTFQWLRDGVPISNATSRAYKLSISSDFGRKISVKVMPKDVLGTMGDDIISKPTQAIRDLPRVENVFISGKPVVGQELTGSYKYIGQTKEGSSSFQWFRELQPITNAKNRSYTLTQADVGNRIYFKVEAENYYSDKGGSGTSEFTDKIKEHPEVSNLSISGTTKVGEKLIARYFVHNVNNNKTTATIEWFTGEGAVNKGFVSYNLTAADIGKKIYFTVTPMSDSGIAGEKKFSTEVGPVVDKDNPKPKPSISDVQPLWGISYPGDENKIYGVSYTYHANGGADEQDTEIKWSNSTNSWYGNNISIGASNTITKLTITPRSSDGVLGDPFILQ